MTHLDEEDAPCPAEWRAAVGVDTVLSCFGVVIAASTLAPVLEPDVLVARTTQRRAVRLILGLTHVGRHRA